MALKLESSVAGTDGESDAWLRLRIVNKLIVISFLESNGIYEYELDTEANAAEC